jgi:purine nucleoside phosphorylase
MDISQPETTLETIAKAAEGLRKFLAEGFTPQVGIICGSGLSSLHLAVHGPRVEVPYNGIKGFPVSTGEY